jgi:branched-chain amino acid transport system permease protein
MVLLASIVIGIGPLASTRAHPDRMMIRAGVDDRWHAGASGVNVQLVFALTFAIGAGLAGLAGVSAARRVDLARRRHALPAASLVVVIVGGMGSVVGCCDRPRC